MVTRKLGFIVVRRNLMEMKLEVRIIVFGELLFAVSEFGLWKDPIVFGLEVRVVCEKLWNFKVT